MDIRLNHKRVAFLFTDGVERAELLEPMSAVREAGGDTVLISPKRGGVQMTDHGEASDLITTEMAAADADPGDFDALVLPGGAANAERLPADPPSVTFVRGFFLDGRPVGAICHGPAMLAEAGVVEGRTLTSWPSLRADLSAAGASWVDQEVCVDGKLVTSRKPADLPAFCAELLTVIDETRRHQAFAL